MDKNNEQNIGYNRDYVTLDKLESLVNDYEFISIIKSKIDDNPYKVLRVTSDVIRIYISVKNCEVNTYLVYDYFLSERDYQATIFFNTDLEVIGYLDSGWKLN